MEERSENSLSGGKFSSSQNQGAIMPVRAGVHGQVVTEGVKRLYVEGGPQTHHLRLLCPVQSLLKLSLLY